MKAKIAVILFHLVWTTAFYLLFVSYYPVQYEQMLVAWLTMALVFIGVMVFM